MYVVVVLVIFEFLKTFFVNLFSYFSVSFCFLVLFHSNHVILWFYSENIRFYSTRMVAILDFWVNVT